MQSIQSIDASVRDTVDPETGHLTTVVDKLSVTLTRAAIDTATLLDLLLANEDTIRSHAAQEMQRLDAGAVR